MPYNLLMLDKHFKDVKKIVHGFVLYSAKVSF